MIIIQNQKVQQYTCIAPEPILILPSRIASLHTNAPGATSTLQKIPLHLLLIKNALRIIHWKLKY